MLGFNGPLGPNPLLVQATLNHACCRTGHHPTEGADEISCGVEAIKMLHISEIRDSNNPCHLQLLAGGSDFPPTRKQCRSAPPMMLMTWPRLAPSRASSDASKDTSNGEVAAVGGAIQSQDVITSFDPRARQTNVRPLQRAVCPLSDNLAHILTSNTVGVIQIAHSFGQPIWCFQA